MGLYDSFYPEVDSPCSFCGEEYKLKGWQTKNLGEEMQEIREGDLLPIVLGLWIEDGLIRCYNYCEACGTMTYAWAIIKNKQFVGLAIMQAEEAERWARR